MAPPQPRYHTLPSILAQTDDQPPPPVPPHRGQEIPPGPPHRGQDNPPRPPKPGDEDPHNQIRRAGSSKKSERRSKNGKNGLGHCYDVPYEQLVEPERKPLNGARNGGRRSNGSRHDKEGEGRRAPPDRSRPEIELARRVAEEQQPPPRRAQEGTSEHFRRVTDTNEPSNRRVKDCEPHRRAEAEPAARNNGQQPSSSVRRKNSKRGKNIE